MRKITLEFTEEFKTYLINEEKSCATLEKYLRDVTAFARWLGQREVNKAVVIEYKKYLTEKYSAVGVNSVLSSLNSFFVFKGWLDCKVKSLKIQKRIFSDRELTKAEYMRLISAAHAKNNTRLFLVMQTICSTGIRVSELEYITAEAVKEHKAIINCKGKMRVVMLTKQLCKMLNDYMKKENIASGSVFITRSGKPLNRSNIWSDMKKLCELAGVSREKVFPHNLRHLFARTYYSLEKDIVRLADILGHSNINTTRIYTMESGTTHQMQLRRLNLLRC